MEAGTIIITEAERSSNSPRVTEVVKDDARIQIQSYISS
jgi:hypothetical protein